MKKRKLFIIFSIVLVLISGFLIYLKHNNTINFKNNEYSSIKEETVKSNETITEQEENNLSEETDNIREQQDKSELKADNQLTNKVDNNKNTNNNNNNKPNNNVKEKEDVSELVIEHNADSGTSTHPNSEVETKKEEPNIPTVDEEYERMKQVYRYKSSSECFNASIDVALTDTVNIRNTGCESGSYKGQLVGYKMLIYYYDGRIETYIATE